MTISNYPQGFAEGVTIRGLPIFQTHTGNVFWVSNNVNLANRDVVGGADGGDGSFRRPFATLQRAINLCTAGTGDVIVIKPGHAETISSAAIVVLNKAGIAVVGMGTGTSRPTFTFTTAATANIPVTAANITLVNLLFIANFADIASFFTATGTSTPVDFYLSQCAFRDTSSILNALTIFTGNATANSCDGLRVENCRIQSLGTTAATTAIKLSSATNRISINDNFYIGAVLNNTAALLAHGANVVTMLEMARNNVFRPNTDTATGGILITTSATTNSGMVYDNKVQCLDVAAAILVTAGSVYGMFNNLYDGDADASGFILPAIGVN